MKFGKRYEDAKVEGGDGGNITFIKYFKSPATTFRIMQNPQDWTAYWEHFNPGGHPFPCTGDRESCPGCTSSNEKMNRASKRVAINVLENGFVNVYKFPKTLAEKLENRYNRIGTVTDRDYTIYKVQSPNGDGSIRTEYDIEGGDKIPVNLESYKLLDVEAMLHEAYEDSWGNGQVTETNLRVDDDSAQQALKETVDDPPFAPKEEKTYTEDELRAMDLAQILAVCEKEGVQPPTHLMTTKEVVDWLLTQ